MAEPSIVTVFGATGQQGGSVARSLLQNKANRFKVRAITRKPESEASKSLASLGATIVKADGWNGEEMTGAFGSSWAAFVNTNSDDPVQKSAIMTVNGTTDKVVARLLRILRDQRNSTLGERL